MDLYDLVVAPFVEFDFMRYALASIFCLALSAAPVGVFLVMRRMSLVGDALSHAVLPGAAIGYMFAGLSLPAMSVGGFAAGLLMALLAGLVSRFTSLKEDANFAAFYLSSLAIGVVLVSKNGSSVDLLHLLFGSVLAVDIPALQLIAVSASVTILLMAVMFRPLVLESIDPLFLKAVLCHNATCLALHCKGIEDSGYYVYCFIAGICVEHIFDESCFTNGSNIDLVS